MRRVFVCVGLVLLAGTATPFLRADNNRVGSTGARANSAFKVLWVFSGASASCTKPLKQNTSLRPTETVSVKKKGELSFETPHLSRCIQQLGSHGSDQLSPANYVALRHLSGSTTCMRPPGDTWTSI